MLALFLIVTLGSVGGFLLTVSTGQIQAASQDEQAVRAYQAAYTGVQWAAFRILRTGADCPALNGQTVVLGNGLAGFSTTVSCISAAEDEGSRTGLNAVRLFHLTVTGCNNPTAPHTCPIAAPGADYVERQLHLTVVR